MSIFAVGLPVLLVMAAANLVTARSSAGGRVTFHEGFGADGSGGCA